MKIAVDAGHGPHTAGKRSPDGALREFQFNAPVALLVSKLLIGYQNVEALLTHDTSGMIDVPLSARTGAANTWGADVLVSVHANAYGSRWNDANGIETFVYAAVRHICAAGRSGTTGASIGNRSARPGV